MKCIVVIGALILTTACGGSLYKVKPVVQTSISDGAAGAESGGTRIRAVPLLEDEEVQELFEANLLLAGILPVRMEIDNQSNAALDLKHARFSLRDAEGRGWKSQNAKKAVSRILKYYDVYLYNPSSRRKFEDDFRAHALDLEMPLADGQQRSGLLFFQTPKKEPVANPQGLVLTIEKLPGNLEVKLN